MHVNVYHICRNSVYIYRNIMKSMYKYVYIYNILCMIVYARVYVYVQVVCGKIVVQMHI